MAASFSAFAQVIEVERLHGGVATAVHRVALSAPAGDLHVVLKRFPPNIGNPEAEWHALEFAQQLSVPTPTPLRLDLTGDWFGAPAIVMSLLPGRPQLQCTDVDAMVDALATTLAAMHDSAPEAVPAVLRRRALWDRWVPDGLPPGAPVRRIVAAVAELRRREWTDWRFCHCDFHPANVLWTDGAVTGVVDWSAGRLAPSLIDIGRLRMELALRLGDHAADAFTSQYVGATGRALDGVEFWDVLAGATVLEHVAEWLPIYGAFGVETGVAELRDRAMTFVVGALDRLGV